MGHLLPNFNHSEEVEPHVLRTREMIKKYPEIAQLMGKNPYTFGFILLVVGAQLVMTGLLSGQAWWLALILAYVFGAFANHALFVLIHECTHNLVFKKRVANMWAGILCDLPNAFPSSISFRRYHLKHHAFQGHYDLDADIASDWEAKMIGNTFFGKAFWLLFFPVFQALRPPRLKEIKLMSKWTWINILVVLAFDIAVVYYLGWVSLLYLAASFAFSIGLHPLGARWIQEHFLVAPPQETYSYYGPLNWVAFNVGYHNEHHDFSSIPWNNLPKLRAIAPEYYDTLVYHKSWTKLWLHFLFSKDLSLYSRTLRSDRGGINVTTETGNKMYADAPMA